MHDANSFNVYTRHVAWRYQCQLVSVISSLEVQDWNLSNLNFLLHKRSSYILNTPNFVGCTGALSAAENARANTRRVSDGAIIPSSQSRAVA